MLGSPIAGALGGDPLKGAIFGTLPELPGKIGEFFKTNAGKAAMSIFGNTGGDMGAIGDLLDNMGITGRSKDMVEEMLTLAALTAFSNKFAKEALNKAKEYEGKEQLAIDALFTAAQKMSDPKALEQTVQASLEDVGKEYKRAKQSATHDLYQRGLGLRMPGATSRLENEEAEARLRARRDIEGEQPMRALQANIAALSPMQNYSERLRAAAEAERALPLEFYKSVKEGTRQNPMDEYYRAMADYYRNQMPAGIMPGQQALQGGLQNVQEAGAAVGGGVADIIQQAQTAISDDYRNRKVQQAGAAVGGGVADIIQQAQTAQAAQNINPIAAGWKSMMDRKPKPKGRKAVDYIKTPKGVFA
ncbi:MAG: hypothetical protein DRJ03_02750 [Chloroflexi bacterium]|nr:MAG: hypothetical protein DRJ03_02750 [Chloroflexota bacterium]